MTLSKRIKEQVEFHRFDIDNGWQRVPGGEPGIEQRLLSGALDEQNAHGVRTRLIRFKPGAIAPTTFQHPYWEEVYLIEGELITGCDQDGKGGQSFTPPGYACRPPGTVHGPFASPGGCLFLEIQYFA